MRFLAFSDIHGAVDRVLDVLAKESPCDAVILGGDLTTFGTPDQAAEAVGRIARSGNTVLAVAGNMDPPSIDDEFRRLRVSLDGCGLVLNGVGVFGVSAAPISPLATPNEITEEEIARRAERGWSQVAGARWTIFVPHAPPKDTDLDRLTSGRHVGSSAVREFVERHQPDLLLCGHIHESRGTDRLGTTLMVNCGPAGNGYYAVVTVNDSVDAVLRP